MLELEADITSIRGADYNPRRITDEDLEALRLSIGTIGIVKPIIVRNQTIVAGHQRTKSLRAIGVTRAPVYWLSRDTTTWDEVRFNQLHNGTDLDFGDEAARVTQSLSVGHNRIEPDGIDANFRCSGAMVRKAICDLIGKYGPWGACVATLSGEVIHAAQYALSAAVSGVPVDVFVVPDEHVDFARQMLNRQYGVFSYDAIERETYIQTLAQPPRPVSDSGKVVLSRLYRYRVEPLLRDNPGLRVLDFGAGRGECARQMRDKGYHVRDLEFFRRHGGRDINKAAVHRMISQVIRDVQRDGPYDVVVNQAVVNSVDSLAAEDAVLGCCSLFLKPGGKLIIDGRSRENYEQSVASTVVDSAGRRPNFFDQDGFTAIYRDGRWFFQKYHYLHEAVSLVERFGFQVDRSETDSTEFSGYWAIDATKSHELPAADYRQYVDFEFNLPWPGGDSVGRSADILELFGL